MGFDTSAVRNLRLRDGPCTSSYNFNHKLPFALASDENIYGKTISANCWSMLGKSGDVFLTVQNICEFKLRNVLIYRPRD